MQACQLVPMTHFEAPLSGRAHLLGPLCYESCPYTIVYAKTIVEGGHSPYAWNRDQQVCDGATEGLYSITARVNQSGSVVSVDNMGL